MKKDLLLFNELANHLLDVENQSPVSTPIPATQLYERLDLKLKDDGIPDDEWLAIMKEVLSFTPKTATHHFFNQLFGGRQGKAVVGDMLASLLNNSMYTYKIGGPHIGIEKQIIHNSCALIDYPKTSNGTIATGGSMSNYMGLVMARDYYDNTCRNQGVTKKMIAYTSKESHYSVSKNASFAGIGRANVRYIKTNERGEMMVSDLETQIKNDLKLGYHPFFVNGTVGTTVLGAFDPVNEIADICEKYKLWFHLDGAYCGTVLFSEKYKHLIKGVNRTDSFCYNAHKMLGTPLSCSMLLVKNGQHLYDSFNNDASYLYQADGDDLNPGKTSFQCGRRNDALKFWALWKSIGKNGIEKLVNKHFELADYARSIVRDNPDYTLYSSDDSVAICFNYKDIDPRTLCAELYENSTLVVGFGYFKDIPFVRLVCVNTNNEKKHIKQFFDLLEAHVGERIEG